MSGGALGTSANPGFVDEGTSARTHHRPPGPVNAPTPTEVEQIAMQAARRLSSALNGIDTRDAIGSFLGGHSFTAGVVYGMAQNLVTSAVQFVGLLKMLALAEYYERQHDSSFWGRFRGSMLSLSPLDGAMGLASLFWPDFDREARAAQLEREVLFKTVAYAFEHPGEVFGHIADEQRQKYEAFKRYRERHSLAGEFQAGVLFGELLLDVLLIVDGVTALARLATKIPGLLEMLPRLRELVPVLRRPVRAATVVEEVAAAPRPVPAAGGRVYDAVNPTGRGGAASSSEAPAASRAVERSAADVQAARMATAREYYARTGWPEDRIDSHLQGIDFSKPVTVEILPKGTQVVQYQIPGNPVGGYFAPLGTPAEAIGVNPVGRVATVYETTADVAVLQSTAADTSANAALPALARGSGGGTQYFAADRSLFEGAQ